MRPLRAALNKNKIAKGKATQVVLEAIAQLDDPNIAWANDEGSQEQSPLAMAIAWAPNEAQATMFADALFAKGAVAHDEHVGGQKHAKAINEAVKKSYYELALHLIEHGARPEHIVHQWLRRPKNSAQAKGQLAMEQLLWQHYDAEQRVEHHVAIMASLLACEVLGGVRTDPAIRQEIARMAREEGLARGWNNHQYLLSNLDDACKALRNPAKALERTCAAVMDWFEGIQGEDLAQKTLGNDRFSHIPQAFWDRLPGLRAERAARILAQDTAPAPSTARSLRL